MQWSICSSRCARCSCTRSRTISNASARGADNAVFAVPVSYSNQSAFGKNASGKHVDNSTSGAGRRRKGDGCAEYIMLFEANKVRFFYAEQPPRLCFLLMIFVCGKFQTER
jgi:hypothetical protein